MAKSVINCSRTQLTPSTNASSSMPSTSNGLKTHSGESGNNVSTLQAGEDDRLSGSSYQERPIVKQPKFEAYMMTGELMLNLSPMERSELQYMHHPHHHHHAPRHRPFYHRYRYNSTPASPVDTRQVNSGNNDGPVQRYNSSPAETGLANNSDSSSNEVSHPKMFNSTPASPAGEGVGIGHGGNRLPPPCVRTSRSEDHLQFQKESSLSTVAVDIDEDITSSLNTLLDTRPDSRSGSSQSQQNGADRIVWTYNAPVSSASERTMPQCNGSSGTSNSTSMSDGMSQRSMSPVSPTSVSSSIMSSTPPAPVKTLHHPHGPVNGDLSLSEAVSNISSPDFQDLDDTFEAGRDCPRMELSDPSDSDSTILVSEPCQKRAKCSTASMIHSNGHKSDSNLTNGDHHKDYRIVIQVKGPDKQLAESPMHKSGSAKGSTPNSENSPGRSTPEVLGYQELHSEDAAGNCETGSDDGSDVDSLHSFHYSPKAVDIPSAVRLAKRLYHLDGFKKSDVSRHLSKNNEFSKAVAEEYVKHFEFASDSLDAALRRFLARFALGGETQERERVLVHFSRRYLECNPGTFNSQDAVHTLTCAIMLLNTDLHGAGAGFRRMTCAEFVDNLAELNDGQDFPREVLKLLYQAIRVQPLEWALDSEVGDHGEAEGDAAQKMGNCIPTKIQSNTFLDIPDQSRAKEFKKGYVMRKSCYEANAKKTPFGKRSWKMFYCTLRDLVLYLHKDERGFRRDQMSDNFHNTIRIHHALATKATDYTKKQHVFRLQTADQAEYLFQTSDSKELQSWIETINFVCAAYSAQPLASAVGSQKKFQRPLLPCSHSKFSLGEQLAEHESRCAALESELKLLKQGSGGPHSQDEENYLQFELKRFRTYVQVLTWKSICSGGEELKLTPPPLPERPPPRHDTAPDADVP